jgi:hypothetical protein
MEKEVKEVTKEEALERIDENLEVIKSSFGTIKFNKIFFGVCAGVGLAATGVGIVGTVVWGLSVASGVTMGLGAAASVTSGIFLSKEKQTELEYNRLEEKNLDSQKVLLKK